MRFTLALVSLVFLAGCSGKPSVGSTAPDDEADSQGMKMMSMLDNSFKDGNMNIAPGVSAMYMNQGERVHTVTIHAVGDPATTFKLDKTLQPGQTVTHVFSAPGTYHVFCTMYGTMTSGMTSTVNVA